MENYKARTRKAFGDVKRGFGQTSKRAKIALAYNASLAMIKMGDKKCYVWVIFLVPFFSASNSDIEKT